MVLGWSESRTVQEFVRAIVPEPFLAGLEAADDRVTRRARVCARVLSERVIAATDMAALRAATEMEPPRLGLKALDAPSPTRRHVWINEICHDETSCKSAKGWEEARAPGTVPKDRY
jgi:hypothetical protein